MAFYPEPCLHNEYHLMIVEDNEDTLSMYRHQLGKLGVHCFFTDSPESALDYYQRNDLDLIICDYQLPEMSGAALLQQFKELAKLKPPSQTEMWILTADSSASCAQKCLQAGADQVLVKPLSLLDWQHKLDHCHKRTGQHSAQTVTENTSTSFSLKALEKFTGPMSNEELKEFVAQYQFNIEQYQRRIQVMAARHDYKEMGRATHSLASSVLLVDAKELSDLCYQLEYACLENEEQEAIQQLAALVKEHISMLLDQLQKVTGNFNEK